MDALKNSPVTAVNIKIWTNRDPFFVSKVRDMVLQGWPNQCPSEEVLKPFTHRKNELSVKMVVYSGEIELWCQLLGEQD